MDTNISTDETDKQAVKRTLKSQGRIGQCSLHWTNVFDVIMFTTTFHKTSYLTYAQ